MDLRARIRAVDPLPEGSTDGPSYTLSNGHTGQPYMVTQPLERVLVFLSTAHVADRDLIRSLDARESVIVGRGAYRVTRAA